MSNIKNIEYNDTDGKFIITLKDDLKYGIFYDMNILCCNEPDFLIYFNNELLKETDLELIKNFEFIKIKSLTWTETETIFKNFFNKRINNISKSDITESFELEFNNSNKLNILCTNYHNGYYPNEVTYYNGNKIDKFEI